MSESEKMLYSLMGFKEILNESNIDEEMEVTCKEDECTLNIYEMIEKCVYEYIENLQPLKFEELKVGMWVWDNENNDYRQIAKINKNGGLYWHGALSEYEADKFKQNRFYRKQVK